MRNWMFGLLTMGLVLVAAGCGDKGGNSSNLAPIQGKVVLADGKPAAFVEVWLMPRESSGALTYGKTDATGQFSVKSLGDQEGMVPGKYVVAVRPIAGKGGTPLSAIPKKLTDNETTDLAVEVRSGEVLTVTIPK